MKSTTFTTWLGTTLAITLLSGNLLAQPDDKRFSIMLGGSFTGTGDMEYRGDEYGEVESMRYRLEAGYTIPVNESLMIEVGGEFDYLETDYSGTASVVPEELTAIAFNLKAFWHVNEKWALSASIAPGFYGDDEVDFSDAFNAPLLFVAHWQKSENLTVALGFRVDVFSDMPVIPLLGVNWKINPDWELSLGLPRTELRYQWNENFSVYTGMAIEGGSYAVDNPDLVSPSGKSLRDTYVSMSEFRGLVGFDYEFDSGVKLTVEGGYAFDRKIDYHEKNVEFEVDSGAFGAVSVSYSF